jgi:hypothetical protein
MSEVVRARIEAEQARRLADLHPLDRMRRYQADAAEKKYAEVAETARRQRAERRDQREREIDQRVRVVVAEEMSRLLDDLSNKFAVPLGELLQRELGALERKLAEVENMLKAKQHEPAPPISLHRRAAN